MTILASAGAAGSVASQAMPGVLGFLIVAAMGLALFFLLRSMNKQLRKVAPPRTSGGPQKVSAAEVSRSGAEVRRGGGESQPGAAPPSRPSGNP